MKLKSAFPIILIALICSTSHAQKSENLPDPTDFGKMWTFEHAPLDYFADRYQFTPDQAWLDRVRMSALQFASWCSASFISQDGLILTNHHCSRGVLGQAMQEGENFDKNGFYATNLEDERTVPNLFVRQLVKIKDITDEVEGKIGDNLGDEEMAASRMTAIEETVNTYSENAEWAGLEIEPVTFYSGVKISLYGYKRYTDIRLVCIPELDMGYFGGDPDNFTYPRYNLDFTIWRVYEDNKPLNSKDFHYPFNPEGIEENALVFAVGFPGGTERYRTMAQYVYDRDFRYNVIVKVLNDRYDYLTEEAKTNDSRAIQEELFGIGNSLEALGGILEAMHNEELMARKQDMEDHIRKSYLSRTGGTDYWKELASYYDKIDDKYPDFYLFRPNPRGSAVINMAYLLNSYLEEIQEPGANVDSLNQVLLNQTERLSDPSEKRVLLTILKQARYFQDEADLYLKKIFKGDGPEKTATRLLEETLFNDRKATEKLLSKGYKKILKTEDPIIELAQILPQEYESIDRLFSETNAPRRALENKIAIEGFNVFGLNLPPDATFTMRLQDGVVKGYEYNGTTAPYFTTYYGMYDRYYSFQEKYPWSLPERWLDPPAEMLDEPLNFVSTIDVIGGNSGSPVINSKGELVGLVFDGNTESLSGNFIYDEMYNRTVGVHAAGIAAALRYIFKADRLLEELGIK